MSAIASFKITSSNNLLKNVAEKINFPISNQKKIGDLKGKLNNKENIYHSKNYYYFKISEDIKLDDAIQKVDTELSKIDFTDPLFKNFSFEKELYFSMNNPISMNLKSIAILEKWKITIGID